MIPSHARFNPGNSPSLSESSVIESTRVEVSDSHMDADPTDWLNGTSGSAALSRLRLPPWSELRRHHDIFSLFRVGGLPSVLQEVNTEDTAKAVSGVLNEALKEGKLTLDQIADIFAA